MEEEQKTTVGKRLGSHFTTGITSEDSTKQPIYPTPQLQNLSIELNVSLRMLLQEATSFAGEWKNVNRRYDDRRSFPRFLRLLQMSGLDWHRYIPPEDKGMDVVNQPNGWPAASHDGVHLRPELTSNSDWVMANKYYRRSLSLMTRLQRIQKESPKEFSREQAELLEDFLGHLITLLKEHRAVARSFSGHLEQLRKESDAVNVDGDGHKYLCPPVVYHMRQQLCERLLIGLYVVSRESTWLLRKLKSSRFTSPSFVEESHKILEITVGFMSKYKYIKEVLGQLSDPGVPGGFRDRLMQILQGILNDFGNCIKRLQAEDVGKGSVMENILDCLGYACNCPYARYPSKPGYYGYGEENNLSTLDSEFIKVVTETSGLINEARKRLNSDKVYTLPGGSPLGNIVLWRILFESSLADLRFDLIRKMLGKAVKLAAKLLHSKTTLSYPVEEHLNRLREEISLLLSDGDRVLLDYVAMHRTVAEITYMLGDVFTTGGAGMKDLSDETGINMDFDLDFPWDKHIFRDLIHVVNINGCKGGSNFYPSAFTLG